MSKIRNETENPDLVVMTVGHSTHPITEFIEILGAHNVECIVDVRTIPRSRHNPQFNKDELPAALHQAGIEYVHMPGLGGLRHTMKDSLNTGWRNASFRGYADYMQTPEFAANLEELIELARNEQVAVMCAEAVPWRCHRSLIGDALLVRGIGVEDILSLTNSRPHHLTGFAKIDGTHLTYPPPDMKENSSDKS